jgi:secreted trypsin-like serine protease
MRRPRAGLRPRKHGGSAVLVAVALMLAALASLVTVGGASKAAGAATTNASTSGGYSAYIVNGKPTSNTKWPFLVEILRKSENRTWYAQFCDGSLVAPTIVLTAAHCITNFGTGNVIDPTAIQVLTGADDLSKTTSHEGTRIDVSAITRDPGYSTSTMLHDEALLTLASPAPAPATPVQVVPGSSDYRWAAGKTAKAAGFGCSVFLIDSDLTDHVDNSDCKTYPTHLQEAPLPLITSAKCESAGRIYATFYNPLTMVCAGSIGALSGTGVLKVGTAKDTCFGDSGGPLAVNGPNGPLLIGIVSWGDGYCGDAPGVFTRLGRESTRNWLRANGVPVAHNPFVPGAGVNVDGRYRTATGDFNNDGFDDVLLYGPGTTSDQILFGSANGFTNGWALSMGGDFTPLAGDFDGDGHRDDVFWYARGAGTDVVWLSDGSQFNASGWSVAQNATATPVVGDFNGDGKDDILWYRAGSASESLWLANGTGFTPAAWSVNVGGTYKPVAGDFNGDGFTDILWYGYGTAPDALWSGGAGAFTHQSIAINGTFRPFAGDFDGDGFADILWYGPGTGIDRLWRGTNTVGRFSNAPEVVAGGNYLPFAGNFNGDANGRADVVWYTPGPVADHEWYGNQR